MTLPEREVERYLARHRDASVAQVLGRFLLDPEEDAEAVAQRLGADSEAADGEDDAENNRPHGATDHGRDTDTNTVDPDGDPETPDWVDDSRAVRDDDLRAPGSVGVVCRECLTDAARASYQTVELPHASAFYQLLDSYGFARALGDEDRVWVAEEGLQVRAHGKSTDPDVGDAYLSYLDVKGEAASVAAFVEDLLDTATYIKRELRAPALVQDADDAQETGERVPHDDRLVGRDRAAAVVARLPEVSA